MNITKSSLPEAVGILQDQEQQVDSEEVASREVVLELYQEQLDHCLEEMELLEFDAENCEVGQQILCWKTRNLTQCWVIP